MDDIQQVHGSSAQDDIQQPTLCALCKEMHLPFDLLDWKARYWCAQQQVYALRAALEGQQPKG